MLSFEDLKDLKVLSKIDFCIIGKIADIVLDESMKKIAYFLCINSEESFLVPMSEILSYGDIVTVEDKVECRGFCDVDFTSLKQLVGKEVYSDEGYNLGKVTNVMFSDKGKVNKILIDDIPLKISEIQGVGNLILMKPPIKRRSRRKNTDLTALANEDDAVKLLSGSENNQENPAGNSPSSSENAILLEHTPPRVVSDYNFLLGRILSADLYTFGGSLIAYKNNRITIEMVEKARLNGKLLELTLNSK